MANTVTLTTILDGKRNLIKRIDILGDGSGEVSDSVVVDVSAHGATAVAIVKEYHQLSGFTAALEWDATADTHIMTCAGEGGLNFREIGGPINNNAGDGKTGDILLTTIGLGSGERGTITLEMVKK